MQYDIFSGINQKNSQHYKELSEFHEHHRTEIFSQLPFALAELTYDLSSEEFLLWISKHGSKKIYLGRDKRKIEKTLDMTIDPSLYTTLCDVSDSANYIEIPSCWGIFSLYRRIAYEEAFRLGVPDDQLIRQFGVSKRTCTNLRNAISSK
jgi:hypothetical protein